MYYRFSNLKRLTDTYFLLHIATGNKTTSGGCSIVSIPVNHLMDFLFRIARTEVKIGDRGEMMISLFCLGMNSHSCFAYFVRSFILVIY